MSTFFYFKYAYKCFKLTIIFDLFNVWSTGGIRALMAAFFGSYEMAIQHYEFEGTGVAYIKGKLRRPDGNVIAGKWLIRGTEGKDKIAVYDKESNEVIHIPKEAKFLRATLKSTNQGLLMEVSNILLCRLDDVLANIINY